MEKIPFKMKKEIFNHNCQYTGGCYKCSPLIPPLKINKNLILPERLSNPLYGREELDRKLKEMAANAPSKEKVWKITRRLPSLTKLLLKERYNE
jgi:hypothetical protein